MGLVVTRRRRGFTLLEVLVAVAILGLALTIILSSQAGLFATAYRTQKLAYASNLVRCKMSEIEVDVVKEGFQLSDVSESGPCCIDDEAESGFSCEWKIQLVEMPTPSSFSEEEDAGISSDLDLGAGPAGSSDPLGGG